MDQTLTWKTAAVSKAAARQAAACARPAFSLAQDTSASTCIDGRAPGELPHRGGGQGDGQQGGQGEAEAVQHGALRGLRSAVGKERGGRRGRADPEKAGLWMPYHHLLSHHNSLGTAAPCLHASFFKVPLGPCCLYAILSRTPAALLLAAAHCPPGTAERLQRFTAQMQGNPWEMQMEPRAHFWL